MRAPFITAATVSLACLCAISGPAMAGAVTKKDITSAAMQLVKNPHLDRALVTSSSGQTIYVSSFTDPYIKRVNGKAVRGAAFKGIVVATLGEKDATLNIFQQTSPMSGLKKVTVDTVAGDRLASCSGLTHEGAYKDVPLTAIVHNYTHSRDYNIPGAEKAAKKAYERDRYIGTLENISVNHPVGSSKPVSAAMAEWLVKWDQRSGRLGVFPALATLGNTVVRAQNR